jgi:hypothetical protein
MRIYAAAALFSLAVGYVLAHFLVLFYNHWYFAGYFWLKTALLTPLLAATYFAVLLGAWRTLWAGLGCWWIGCYSVAAYYAGGMDLRPLGFTSVLDLEAAYVWAPLLAVAAYAAWRAAATRRIAARGQRLTAAVLRERRHFRRTQGVIPPEDVTSIALCILGTAVALIAAAAVPSQRALAGDEPVRQYADRHSELKDPAQRLWPTMPDLPGTYPTPMHLRARETFLIVIENKIGGAIYALKPAPPLASAPDPQGAPAQAAEAPASSVVLPAEPAEAPSPVHPPPQAQQPSQPAQPPQRTELGHVLVVVDKVNPEGFTAAGWAGPGTVCASAVNAIHIKTAHDYATGRATIFSLLPKELGSVQGKQYASYLSPSSSLMTDIPGGTGLFGGEWAPLVGSTLLIASGDDPAAAAPAKPGYVPREGDTLVLRVERRKYNPEWIEFENRFGGIIWVKELGLDPYPIGQVLKPAVGVGRFLGSQYADVGRIRASHPGVLCISTSPMGEIGGFQIIPRDHAMSAEMIYARSKTQWMVVGPLWALDASWEGLPPLFTDYFYPAFTPALNPDGSINEDVHGAAVFLDRFTVRGRYSDAADPWAYELLRPVVGLDNLALRNLTHLRIYFPRG